MVGGDGEKCSCVRAPTARSTSCRGGPGVDAGRARRARRGPVAGLRALPARRPRRWRTCRSGIFREVARPDVRRPGARAGRRRGRQRGRPGHRRRPRRPARRARHLDGRADASAAPHQDRPMQRRVGRAPAVRLGTTTASGRSACWGVFPLYFRAARSRPAPSRSSRTAWSGRCSSACIVLAVRGSAGAAGGRCAAPRLAGSAVGGRAHRGQLGRLHLRRSTAARWSRPRSGTSSTRWSPCCSAWWSCANGCAGCSGWRWASAPRRWSSSRRRTAARRWIALALALLVRGCTGCIKKQVGANVAALTSLTTETLVLAPAAVGAARLARG